MTGQTELSWAGDLSEIEGGQFALVGLLRATDYQMRAKAIARVRQTVWTGWQDVRTPDIGFDPADLSDRTWDAIHSDATAIASALSQDATISDLEALLEGHRDREQAARNVALATEDLQALVKDTGETVATARQELSAQIERNVASLVTLNKARADGESALAQANSALTTTVGNHHGSQRTRRHLWIRPFLELPHGNPARRPLARMGGRQPAARHSLPPGPRADGRPLLGERQRSARVPRHHA